ncbi:hypothetical protein A6V39_05070 [Candidatus Mycoplasma haematobovis]|uniref:Uncharacterized protein n=1 Tax=Candidatus Mycoplasma haematobovis TaxID=432608 RepID=A0A1A9QDN0_9MOLU|nr:hypothetical protein [Candidatus Mycoplasma haematobovis]OAL09799.1 hypothetical protein A6V39_05070 [Candidatus Mycoplasma haematobovis]
MGTSLVAKVVANLIGATAIATGGYFTYDYLTKEYIQNNFKKNEIHLLTDTDYESEWLKRWKEYVENRDNKWKIKDYPTDSTNLNKVPKDFKETCFNKAKDRSDNLQNLDDVKKWCTKSFKIATLLETEELVEFITGDNQEPAWKEAWNKYLSDDKHWNSNFLNINNFENAKKTPNNLPTDYKTKCEILKETEVRNKDESDYYTVKTWCTKLKTKTNL